MASPLMDADAVMTEHGVSRHEAIRMIWEAGGWRTFRLVVRADMLTPHADRLDRAVMEHLRAHGPTTQAALSAALGEPRIQISKSLARLRGRRRVSRSGSGTTPDPYTYAPSIGL